MNRQETRFVLTAKNQTNAVFRAVRGNLNQLGRSVTGLHAQLLGLAGVGGLGLVVSGLVDTNAEMQRLKSALKTVTGGAEEASVAFDRIEEFALTTPYDLNEVIAGFIRLKSLGLDPSERALRSYGNTAAAMGKSFEMMIDAVSSAATGEFEQLKNFGIKAGVEDVTAGTFFAYFKGQKQVFQDLKQLQEFLLKIGETDYAGAMADQMNNLIPAFSNFKAALQDVQVQIGEAGLNDVIRDLTHDMTDFINSFDEADIERFTQAAINGFADILESTDQVLKTLNSLPYLTELGLVGYILFGKKGVAGAAAGSFAIDALAKKFEEAFQRFQPGVLGAPGGQFTGPNPFANPYTRGYQLGDFNAGLMGEQGAGFRAWRDEIRAQSSKMDEEISILQTISDRIRESAARAG